MSKHLVVADAPQEECTATTVVVRGFPKSAFPIIQIESCADCFLQGPRYIDLSYRKDGWKRVFEQIVRVQQWIDNVGITSWSLYCENREWQTALEKGQMGGIVIRTVSWDRKRDANTLRSQQAIADQIWPSLHIVNAYVSHSNIGDMLPTLLMLDRHLQNGIVLKKRVPQKSKIDWKKQWAEIELLRLFNWGQVHSIWTTAMENKGIEQFIPQFVHLLEEFATSNKVQRVPRMELNYFTPPGTWKGLVDGTRNGDAATTPA